MKPLISLLLKIISTIILGGALSICVIIAIILWDDEYIIIGQSLVDRIWKLDK